MSIPRRPKRLVAIVVRYFSLQRDWCAADKTDLQLSKEEIHTHSLAHALTHTHTLAVCCKLYSIYGFFLVWFPLLWHFSSNDFGWLEWSCIAFYRVLPRFWWSLPIFLLVFSELFALSWLIELLLRFFLRACKWGSEVLWPDEGCQLAITSPSSSPLYFRLHLPPFFSRKKRTGNEPRSLGKEEPHSLTIH